MADEPTLSDHRHIVFRISSPELPVFFRNSRRVDWDSYKEVIDSRLVSCSYQVTSFYKLDGMTVVYGTKKFPCFSIHRMFAFH